MADVNDKAAAVKRELRDLERALAESTIVAKTDHEGTITCVNEKFCEISKYSAKELIGQNHRMVNSGHHSQEFFEELWSTIEKGKIWRGEIKNQAKDGTHYWVHTTIVPFLGEDGIPIQYIAIRHDITDQKSAIERVHRQSSLLDQTRDAIMVADLNQKIVFWNLGAEKLYNWSAEEAVGRDVCGLLCGGDHSLLESAINSLLTEDEWHAEAVNFTRENKSVTVISRWTLVRNEFGEPDYFLVVNSDVTKLKKAEKQLLRSQRLESIGTLAGGIAHDLNNVLSPIMLAVDMLQTDPDVPDSTQEWLSIIKENTERGAHLIRQVLTFARGSGDGVSEQVQISYLIKELVKVWKKTLRKSIRLEYRIANNLPLITADPTQIDQVLMNLVVNAKDAIPETGGLIRLTADSFEVDKTFAAIYPDARPGPYLRVQVEDTGSGMEPEILERIWDPFFTTKAIGKGTGLGLSTTLSIVTGTGGFVTSYSEVGKGSIFCVYLPLSKSDKNESEPATKDYPTQGNNEIVLIVDDEEAIRRITKLTLENNGYRTLTASDGARAVEIFEKSESIDVIITDMAMPGMDGTATIKAIREINADQKIIVCSGLTSYRELSDSGIVVDDFLTKPFTRNQLLASLARAIK